MTHTAEQVERIIAERDAYALALAGQYSSAKVNEVLGQQTLCSSKEYRELHAEAGNEVRRE